METWKVVGVRCQSQKRQIGEGTNILALLRALMKKVQCKSGAPNLIPVCLQKADQRELPQDPENQRPGRTSYHLMMAPLLSVTSDGVCSFSKLRRA